MRAFIGIIAKTVAIDPFHSIHSIESTDVDAGRPREHVVARKKNPCAPCGSRSRGFGVALARLSSRSRTRVVAYKHRTLTN